MSTEVGLLMGYMAKRVLGQYDLVLFDESVTPRPPRLLFVLPNLGHAVRSFDADEDEFMTWVTLHEVTHAVQFGGVPWLQRHLSGLVGELLAGAQSRIERPRRLQLPSREGVSRFAHGLRSGDLMSIVMDDAERVTLDKVQAVMAVIEGHAEHVMDAVAPDLLPSLPRLRRALDARRHSQRGLSKVITRLLGVEMKLRQYERGKVFCDALVARAGPAALTQLFSSPDALPSLEEIERPSQWLERAGL
jgi:coenzyme F420 biosynthesis associated uncharacterized protein